MIELPESVVLASEVCERLLGAEIVRVEADHSPHKFAWYCGKPENYPALLTGKHITGANGLGSNMEILAEDCHIVFSDGANLKLYDALEPPPKKHQLMLAFDNGLTLYVSVQMYGGLLAFTDETLKNEEEWGLGYYKTAKSSLSALSDSFDYDYFKSLYSDKDAKLSTKAFLATKQRIAGLGNGVLQDILFNARLNPKRKMNTLSEEEYRKMFDSVKGTLSAMMLGGGRNTESNLDGCKGGYECILCKNTYEKPCPVCGGEIVKEAYMGGAVYYCPNCQKLG